MLTGGAYRTHHQPSDPPAPPPPQLPASLSSSSSSMSTLSALAPPFTLDHAFPPPPPLHPIPPQPHPVSHRLSASRLAPHTSADGSLPCTLPPVDPYYGRYYSNSQGRPFDDSFGSSSSYSLVGRLPWKGPFDEEAGRGIRADAVSPWTEPTSSHKVPNCREEPATDDCCYYENDSYGVWHGKLTDSLTGHFGSQHSEWLQDKRVENYEDMTSSYSVFNAPFSTPSTSLGVHSSGTVGANSGKGSTFVMNSTYDKYMAQLDSCSVNPLVCYPPPTCSTSAQTPTTFKAGPNLNSTLQSTTIYDVPYKMDELLTTASRLKEPCLNQNIVIKGGDDEKRQEGHNKPRIVTIATQPAESGKVLTLSKNGVIESHLNSSVGLKPELKLKNVANADASPARCCSMEPDISIRSSSEALDQHNLAVDSPCWKGAPTSRQSPFTVDAMLVKVASVESKDFNDPSQDQNHLLENTGNPQSPMEHVGRLNLDKCKNSFISENPQFFPDVSSCLHQYPESGDKNEFLCDNVHREQIDKTIKSNKRNPEAHGFSSTNFVETENTAVDNFPPVKDIENNKGTSSLPQKNMKDLVKAIHNYSVDLLLSTDLSNDELEPPYLRLLYSVISNLSLVLGESKGFAGFCYCSGLEAARSCNRCINAEDVSRSLNQSRKAKEKTYSDGYNNCICEFDNFGVKGSEAGLQRANGMTQTVENAISENFPDKEENERPRLYKNLWIEAETANCRLKYELQLARLRTESENPKPPQSDISSALPFAPDLKGYNAHAKAKTSSLGTSSPSLCSGSQPDASACHGLNKSEDIVSSVMARLKVLQARNVSLNNRIMEEQETPDTEDSGICSGTNQNAHGSTSTSPELNKSEDIESSVMARLQVLKARNITLNNRNVEEQEAPGPAEDARICPGADENVHGSYRAEINTEKNDLLMNLAELGFVESVAQSPYANEKHSSGRSFFSSESFGAKSDEQGQCSNYPVEQNTLQMLSSPLNELLIQSYWAYNQMSHSYGHEVPSSFEWEHVPEEESLNLPRSIFKDEK